MRAPEAPSKPGDVEPRPALGLFQGFGVEIEYMIVDRESLDVRPVADDLMAAQAGEAVAELERGAMAWSNELALHVLELKTNGPAPSLQGLHPRFHAEVRAAEGCWNPWGVDSFPGVPIRGWIRTGRPGSGPTSTPRCIGPSTGSSGVGDTGGPTCSPPT
jgi:hypothetical protein